MLSGDDRTYRAASYEHSSTDTGALQWAQSRALRTRLSCNWYWTVRHHARMEAYSEDLRKKIVEAVERGMPKAEAARLFGVGISSVKRYVATAKAGWSLAPKKRPGSKPKMDETARRLWEAGLEERPAATLPQRREYLGRVAGERLHGLADAQAARVESKKVGWERRNATSC